MYNDRVLRGNTYAILKNANRNIDTNIKPPTLPQKIEIYKEVYILFRKSIYLLIISYLCFFKLIHIDLK